MHQVLRNEYTRDLQYTYVTEAIAVKEEPVCKIMVTMKETVSGLVGVEFDDESAMFRRSMSR